jgi:hypothetical protein
MLDTQIIGNVRDFLRWVFGNASRITDPKLKVFLYTASRATTKIIIDAGGYKDYDNIGRRPAIYVDMAPSQDMTVNQLQDYTVTVDSVDQTSAADVHLDSGQIMVYCVGLEAAQTRALAKEVYDAIRKYSGTLKDDFSLFSITALQKEQPKPMGQEGGPADAYIATVAVPWTRFDSWTIS